MNTLQLECVLHYDPYLHSYALGVFSRDHLPIVTRYPCCFILNTDRSGHDGTHWLAIFIDVRRRWEFFDSYGYPPSFYGLTLKHYNVNRLQSSSSLVCGQYCLMYLMYRCRGFNLSDFSHLFYNDFHVNDVFVYNFIIHSFPYCLK